MIRKDSNLKIKESILILEPHKVTQWNKLTLNNYYNPY